MGFFNLTRKLNILLAHEKTQGPSQMLTFQGVELDTVQQASRLPECKLHVLQEQIQVFHGQCKVTLHELQQLIGHLNFACKVVAPGRAFCLQLFKATRGLRLLLH